jgi:demethylmenaquinone methyltransferase/2-methoxy-6-polyprenyl-1,4-benzoquinol methylase
VRAPSDPAAAALPPAGAPHPDLAAYYDGPAARRPFVAGLFDRTARSYDRIVGGMALGSGRRYRRQALARAGVGPGMTVLDVAVGTGLVAREALRLVGPRGGVIGLDLSLGMLRQARANLPIPLIRAFAEALPLASASLDALTMGYALRHVCDLAQTFREFLRVLRPGGRLVVLELSRPPRRSAAYRLARFYLRTVVPSVARLTEGREAATLMRYFWETIDGCVPPETILAALTASGFAEVSWQRPAGPVFSEYVARKPA